MNEWLLIRLMMLGAMVGGGILLALAGTAADRLRERRARARNARQREVLAAEYRANPIDVDRLRERRASARATRGSGASTNYRVNLTAVATPRSSTP